MLQNWGWSDGLVVKITVCSSRGPGFKSQHPYGVGTKKWGGPWEDGGEKRPTPRQSSTYSLLSQAWEGCYLPYPLIPGWAFLYPTLQGVAKGQPCLGTTPPRPHWSYFAEATKFVGEREWGKKFPKLTRVSSGP